MEFTLTTTILAPAEEIYSAWLSSKKHTLMTGGIAVCSDKEGREFTAWDGYIQGVNVKLIPYKKIIQSWRTDEFKEEETNSQIELSLVEKDDRTELTILHTNLPKDGEHYKKGWEEHYFIPMKTYFS